MRKVGLLLFVPFLWITSPIVGYVIGMGIDWLLHTKDTFSIIFIFFGIAAAARETYLIVKRVLKQEDINNGKN